MIYIKNHNAFFPKFIFKKVSLYMKKSRRFSTLDEKMLYLYKYIIIEKHFFIKDKYLYRRMSYIKIFLKYF